LSQLPQDSAPDGGRVRRKSTLEDPVNCLREDSRRQKKAAASQVMSPFTGQLEASIALPRFNRCWPLRTFQNFCGRPFLGVSFRTFTARSNAEKGTPAAQLFDNRSIA